MYNLLLAAIYGKDQPCNAVLLTSLSIQGGLHCQHDFFHRLCMLISRNILSQACSVYRFAVFMINLQHAYPVRSLTWRSRCMWFKLGQQICQNLHTCITNSQVHDVVHLLKKRCCEQVGGSGLCYHEFASIEDYLQSDASDVQHKSNV